MVRLLLDRGADPLLEGTDGKSFLNKFDIYMKNRMTDRQESDIKNIINGGLLTKSATAKK